MDRRLGRKPPRISVLMSCYNAERYLPQAIESILRQTLRDFEFLIADDGSKDRTLAIIERYAKKDKRIRVIRNPGNLGRIPTLNMLISLARGEYLARMDADDECAAGRFAAQVAFLDAHPHVGIVGTQGAIIDGEGRKFGHLDYALDDTGIRHWMLGRNQFAHPSVMLRAKAIADVGGYDNAFRGAEDHELFARILTRWSGANLSGRYLRYRWDLHNNEGFTSGKNQERKALKARVRMLTKYHWPPGRAPQLLRPLAMYAVPMRMKLAVLRKMMRSNVFKR